MTKTNSFYVPIWEYNGFKLVSRPDTPNLYITWTPKRSGRYRRKSTGTTDVAEAQRLLVAFAAKTAQPTNTNPEDVELIPLILTFAENGPAKRYSISAIRCWSEFCAEFGIRTVADMTLDAQDRFIEWRRARRSTRRTPISNSTISSDLKLLRAALKYAWKRNRLSSMPHIRSVASSPPRSRFLTQDEVRDLLSECHLPHLRLFVICALHTVQRPAAILRLKADQIDFNKGVIDFLPAGEIQSHKRRPVVPITKTLRPLLENAVNNSMTGHIIEHNGVPVKHIYYVFCKARDRAGLGSDVIPYTLRHTGATHLAASGVPLRQISGMMGHSIVQTTEMYAKHSPDFLLEARDSLDTVFAV